MADYVDEIGPGLNGVLGLGGVPSSGDIAFAIQPPDETGVFDAALLFGVPITSVHLVSGHELTVDYAGGTATYTLSVDLDLQGGPEVVNIIPEFDTVGKDVRLQIVVEHDVVVAAPPPEGKSEPTPHQEHHVELIGVGHFFGEFHH